jgi:hypothetical protein
LTRSGRLAISGNTMHARGPRSGVWALSGSKWLAVALAFGLACSKQGEGERCALDNDDADCASGLQCRPGTGLGLGADLQGAGLCCPENGPSTAEVCRSGANLPPDVGDAGNPTPAATPPASNGNSSTRDAGPDASDGG